MGTPSGISYRKVLQTTVPAGQRGSTRTLVQAHGLSFPASLRALIQVLESPVGGGGGAGGTATIGVSLGFAPGDLGNRVLQVTGQGFTRGEKRGTADHDKNRRDDSSYQQ